MHKPKATHMETSTHINHVFRTICSQRLISTNRGLKLQHRDLSICNPTLLQTVFQRTNAASVAFNDTHVHTLFRAVSNLSFKPPLCQRLPAPKVCSQDRRQLPLCPCRWYPAAWSWGRPQRTTWQAPWRT